MQAELIALAETGSAGPADLAKGPGVAGAADVRRFDDLMNAQDDLVAPIEGAARAEAAKSGTGLGDSILKGLHQVSTDLQSQWNSIGSSLSGSHPLQIRDLLKLQMDLAGMSMQYEIFAKGVGKATQDIDQLVKQQ